MLRSGGVAYSTGQITVSVADTTTTSVLLSDIGKGEFLELDWRPAANTTGVRFGLVGYAEHSTNNDITGAGHLGGVLGYAQKTGTGTDALVIGVEGRVGAVAGTATIAASFVATFDTDAENAGAMTFAVGYYLGDQTDSAHIANKFSFFSDDPNFIFRNDGPATINGKISQDTTITPPGTTGAQTINKPTGKVNFAGGATSLVVTNSLVTASSIIFCAVQTIDAVCFAAFAVPAAGSFTIYPVGTPVGEVKVGFMVIN